MPLRLYNTLTKKVEEFIPANPEHVTFYTCGPTVYDDAHIGNFRSFLAADLLRRFIESPRCQLSRGPNLPPHFGPRRVTHVMNITDVGHMTDDAEGGEQGEDRMAVAGRRLEEAKKSGKLPAGVEVNPRDPYQIARFYEGRFREDAKKLGLKISLQAEKDATLHPRATEHVAGMIALVRRLIETTAPDGEAYAYVAGATGSRAVYFRVQAFPGYGALSGNTLDRLKEGEGGRVSAANQSQKRHPADFLLWKEDGSHIMKWESPWGWGYPGWHIECSVMSLRARGEAATPETVARLMVGDALPLLDLHSGGEDNIFPHHECEIAQSCCAFNASPGGAGFAKMWFHPRFLLVEGTKMSKSKGNFFTARDLFERGIEPAAVRLELIKTHYRSNANFTMQGLQDSQRTIERWKRLRLQIARQSVGWDREVKRRFEVPLQHGWATALELDLNIAEAIGHVEFQLGEALRIPFDQQLSSHWSDAQLCASMTSDITDGPFDALASFDQVIGVLGPPAPLGLQTEIGVFASGLTPDPAVEALLRQRRDARAAKDFKTSDAIRDQLAGMGLAIKDLAGGKVEVRRA